MEITISLSLETATKLRAKAIEQNEDISWVAAKILTEALEINFDDQIGNDNEGKRLITARRTSR